MRKQKQVLSLVMRNSYQFLLFISAGLLLVLLSVIDANSRQDSASEALSQRATLVAKLGLSDLALSTEARYTRNLSLADRHSAFQDHPVSFDYFPSGSIFLPPSQLTQ